MVVVEGEGGIVKWEEKRTGGQTRRLFEGNETQQLFARSLRNAAREALNSGTCVRANL